MLRIHPIKRKTWYQLALLFPLLLPAVLWGVNTLYPFPGWLGALYFYLFCAAGFGGVQYVAFASGVVWWGRNKTADEFRRASWLWPILFVPICALGLPFVVSIQRGAETRFLDKVSGLGLSMGLFAVPIGYFYVCIVSGLTLLFQKLGWVIENQSVERR